jgi:hypothetical protein
VRTNMYFFFFVCSRLAVHVNKVVVPIFRIRKFVPAVEGSVGRVDCDGQEERCAVWFAL